MVAGCPVGVLGLQVDTSVRTAYDICNTAPLANAHVPQRLVLRGSLFVSYQICSQLAGAPISCAPSPQ